MSTQYTPLPIVSDSELEASSAQEISATSHPSTTRPGGYEPLNADGDDDNGLVDESHPSLSLAPPGLFWRAISSMTSLLSVPTEGSSSRPCSPRPRSPRLVGGGMENDGVFANVMAKPTVDARINADGVYVVPEDSQLEAPPSYSMAQADAVPAYPDGTAAAAPNLSFDASLIEGLPAGNFIIFLFNGFIAVAFPIIGFIFTYLFHTTHAAKFGGRAGLGLSLLRYGLSLVQFRFDELVSALFNPDGDVSADTPSAPAAQPMVSALPFWAPGSSSTPNVPSVPSIAPTNSTVDLTFFIEFTPSAVTYTLGFLLMCFGWAIFFGAVYTYFRIRSAEKSLRPRTPPAQTPSQLVVSGPQVVQPQQHVINMSGPPASVSIQVTFGPWPGGASENATNSPSQVQAQERAARLIRDAELMRTLRESGVI